MSIFIFGRVANKSKTHFAQERTFDDRSWTIQSFKNSRAISFNPREKFSRSIQLVHPIRRGWKTGTKPNYEHAGAPEVLYDYLTEHAATNGRFVPFKYMIARDFSHSPPSSPPTTLWVRTRPHYSPLQVFHPAAPG